MMSALKKVAVLLLTSSTVFAQTTPASGGQAQTQTKTTTTTRTRTTTRRTSTRKPTVPPVTAEDIRALRDAIAAQQQQLDQMRQAMLQRDQQLQQTQQQLAEAQAAARDAQTKVSAVESANNESKPVVSQLQNDMADVKTTLTNTAASTQEDQKRVSELASTLGRFRFVGDVRVRYENFLQDGIADRHRPRVRLRFGVEGKLNQDFMAGVSVASGALNDPSTSNSTFGDGFQRKPISWDKGYLTYNPAAHKWLSLTGGKFAYTWIRTNQTFDPDINPEGFSEKLSFDLKAPVLKNVTFTGLQLLFNETNGQVNNVTTVTPKFNTDSWAYGGQASVKMEFGPWQLTPSYSILNFRNPDVLINGFASLIGGGQTIDPTRTDATIAKTTGLAPNGMTNAVCPGTIGGVILPVFCSQFLYSDVILTNVIKTPLPKFPFNLVAEYETNLNARSNNKHLYVVDGSIGQTKNKNDVQFGYAFIRSEQDAVIASWAESDQRFPTNILQHRVSGAWKIAPNIVLSYTQWIGRALDTKLTSPAFGFSGGKPFGFSPVTAAPGAKEPWLKRGQLDVIYTF